VYPAVRREGKGQARLSIRFLFESPLAHAGACYT
jgi:hypothetical protein